MPQNEIEYDAAANRIVADEKPTLKTIARLSGLAVPTVSRALNDAPDIGSETKKLVRKIANDIGYVPNRAGVRLRTGRTNVISLMMSTEHDLMSHTARLIASVAGGLRHTPFHMIVTPFFPDQDPMEPVRYIVETVSADAIIMNQIQPKDPRVAYLMKRGFPFATYGRTDWADQHPYYDFDNSAFGEIAVRQLAARGRKTILVIAPPPTQSYAQHMVSGIGQSSALHDVAIVIADGITSDTPSAEVVTFMQDALRKRPDIDAVVTASSSSAMAAVAAIEQHGAQVGQQIDVFAKEAIPFLKLFRNDILTISENVDAAGKFLAEAAIQAIRNPDEPPLQSLQVPEDR
ncbi:LacI family transcriptional regulator [Cognatiyoonia sp. IB215182]|uniref:LacI family transcriptional regulator n=1 Tax=Cognatiyoonia sp. IB215182 TaxID=3097353 RepID=UPI002A183003|nr:LacI family transcriptional regulator [Cognatiyoonia sp. IB215182]MDX8352822.1 LacI family transcriptional regulator [Cognatiyoonia sp. IB215182]